MQLRTINTIGELKKILAYFDDDAGITLVENRYRGGGDEYYECDIVVADREGELIVSPKLDAGIAGVLLNVDEL